MSKMRTVSFKGSQTQAVVLLLLSLIQLAFTQTELFFDPLTSAASHLEEFDIIKGSRLEELSCEAAFGEEGMTLKAPYARNIFLKPRKYFEDNGQKPVLYSVKEGGLTESKIVFNRLYARLGRRGFTFGYRLDHYFDGKSAFVNLSRLSSNSEEVIYESVYAEKKRQETKNKHARIIANEFLALEERSLKVLGLLLKNTETSVEMRIYFDGKLLATINDESPDRILSGEGVGIGYFNNEAEAVAGELNGGSFAELRVTLDPEIIQKN